MSAEIKVLNNRLHLDAGVDLDLYSKPSHLARKILSVILQIFSCGYFKNFSFETCEYNLSGKVYYVKRDEFLKEGQNSLYSVFSLDFLTTLFPSSQINKDSNQNEREIEFRKLWATLAEKIDPDFQAESFLISLSDAYKLYNNENQQDYRNAFRTRIALQFMIKFAITPHEFKNCFDQMLNFKAGVYT